MSRTGLVVVLLAALFSLAAASLAFGSDASLEGALKPYQKRLTADIGYLASFTVPRRHAVAGVLRKLSKIRKDLAGAMTAAKNNQASSPSGQKGRTLVLSGLHDASNAAGKARACALAVRAGKHLAAKRDQKQERSEINKAIPLLESGGKLLHLF